MIYVPQIEILGVLLKDINLRLIIFSFIIDKIIYRDKCFHTSNFQISFRRGKIIVGINQETRCPFKIYHTGTEHAFYLEFLGAILLALFRKCGYIKIYIFAPHVEFAIINLSKTIVLHVNNEVFFKVLYSKVD